MSEDTWYGPRDTWPRHPKPYFRDALEHARAAGWHLREVSGHSFCTVHCRRGTDESCFFAIFSTGRGGESVAGALRKKVDACAHGPAPAPDATALWVADITTRLEQVETMLDAAARCLAAESHRDAAYELLGQASSAMSDIDQLLEAAQAAQDRAVEVVAETWAAVQAQVPGLPFPAASAQVIRHVHVYLAETETKLASPPGGEIPELPGLRARSGVLRDELDRLRAQLPPTPDDGT